MASVRSVSGSGYGSIYVDSLVWGGTAWDTATGPIKVYFGGRSDLAAAMPFHDGVEDIDDTSDIQAWTQNEIGAFNRALDLYESVCGLTFEVASTVQDANIVWWKTFLGDDYLGLHERPASTQIWGYFNSYIKETWSELRFGGGGFNTIIHELGHGMGLAHPHDGGDGADKSTFPGVKGEGHKGQYGLNQGVYTIMSYNTGFGTVEDQVYGSQAGLGAFDIAALQALYGANTTTASGDNVYRLPTRNAAGTGWSCIWDTGGSDTISGAKSKVSVTIDLRAATLANNDPKAGGFLSRQEKIAGGYTIASGVTIENATGGSGNDILYGNSAANTLRGGAGQDKLRGLAGDDILYCDNGKDTLWGGSGSDTFVFSVRPGKSNVDTIKDFNVQDDSFHLRKSAFKKLVKGELAEGAFHIGSSAHDQDDRIIYSKKSGKLSYDPDGSGKAAAVQIALLSKNLKEISNQDFFVI